MSGIDWDTPEIAGEYDKNCDHQFLKGRMLVEMMGISEGDNVLDLGCGTGRQAEHISGIIGISGHLTGIDPSSHRLAIAKNRFSSQPDSNVLFHRSQAEYISFLKDSFYDHALFCSSFHWVDDKPTALTQVHRVLKPGGCIGMTTLNREKEIMGYDILNDVLDRYGLPKVKGHGHEGMKRVTLDELTHLLANAGFGDISIELKVITAFRHSPADILDKQGQGSFHEITRELPESLRQEIREDFIREYDTKKEKNSSESGPGTLFALAKKER